MYPQRFLEVRLEKAEWPWKEAWALSEEIYVRLPGACWVGAWLGTLEDLVARTGERYG